MEKEKPHRLLSDATVFHEEGRELPQSFPHLL